MFDVIWFCREDSIVIEGNDVSDLAVLTGCWARLVWWLFGLWEFWIVYLQFFIIYLIEIWEIRVTCQWSFTKILNERYIEKGKSKQKVKLGYLFFQIRFMCVTRSQIWINYSANVFWSRMAYKVSLMWRKSWPQVFFTTTLFFIFYFGTRISIRNQLIQSVRIISNTSDGGE